MAAQPEMQRGVRSLALPGGEMVPVLGIGTWRMGESRKRRADEIAALQTAVDLGMTVIDTAEMYADGGAEEVVADALRGRRSEIFLVSKVMPQHATSRGTVASCEASLRRLKTERLDMYLLHWRGSVPMDETLEAFTTLQRDGKIRYWGVSNFDVDDMQELVGSTTTFGSAAAVNQVLYNPKRRGVEFSLIPWCQTRGIPIMAYSPLEQGKLLANETLRAIGTRLNATPAQIALAWVLRHPGVIAIPKAGHFDRVHENRRALELELAPEDLAEIDEAFPPPTRQTSLEMI